MLGLPFPFVSMPLGVCALALAALVGRHDMKLALWPLSGAALYWGIAVSLWLT